ncbi:hypothetical protein [Peromfec virus RodF8_28]|uniref:Uncharacterized protein n=1 Tax=Peromfec virus RodF8_28 TaxID=2929366 RepID=A0A976N346_9VIRU|nr:hypothetical protein [Peromfec virus RodF8_28]
MRYWVHFIVGGAVAFRSDDLAACRGYASSHPNDGPFYFYDSVTGDVFL